MINLAKFFKRYENGDRPLGSRLSTIKLAFHLLNHYNPINFVETGTARKNHITHPNVEDRAADGCSTVLFGDYCYNVGSGKVWTCDISAENIDNCKIGTEQYKKYIEYVVMDSVDFLSTFNDKIDFLYLDSLDSHANMSAEHQLKEIKAAFDKIHNKTIILLDDLGQKTKLSIPFLKENNWCQIQIDVPKPSTYNNFMQGLFVHESFLYINHANIPQDLRYKDI
jgi:hypothetical protein